MKDAEVWIGVIVAVVLIGGLTFLTQAQSPTGNVVREPCDCRPGLTVCAADGSIVSDYPSACHAVCAGARIVYDDRCVNIPRL